MIKQTVWALRRGYSVAGDNLEEEPQPARSPGAKPQSPTQRPAQHQQVHHPTPHYCPERNLPALRRRQQRADALKACWLPQPVQHTSGGLRPENFVYGPLPLAMSEGCILYI